MNQVQAAQSAAETASASGDATLGMAYDPATERAVARRLRGARWRRVAFLVSAVAVAAAAAAAFTHANRDTVAALVPPPAPVASPAPAPAAPSLASSMSRPVTLPGEAADPNKVQARIVVPADPEPPAAAPPIQMQAPPATPPRTISLTAGPPPAAAPTASEDASLPSAALGFAPLPAPRPARAP